ncbi:MAG: UvrD-helicase domain-containing protein [Bacilli bacterium]|nr:UvrD-helicase domain-containing protein [Bacilli bacterium]
MEKYINRNDYLNLKKDNKSSLLLKYKIYKNNRNFIKNKLNNKLVVNDIELDNDQKEAVYTNEKNVLVLAGAGSGKTLTIVSKINYLINELNIKEEEILCLSFTNETVDNLKKRIDYHINIFTFHKLAIEIIKDYKNVYLAPSDYLNYIINEIFLSIVGNIDDKTLSYFNNTISSFINVFKVNNLGIDKLNRIIKKNRVKILELIKKIYLIYEEELSSSGMIDLNDLIVLATKLIKEKGLKKYYKYIIVDEFQDISITRLELLKEIIKSCNSFLFAVGDDYQSIYKFAGSRLSIITRFKKYFGYTKIIKIRNTYRNSKELIKVSTDFIKKNRNQIRKKITSNKSLYKPIKIIYYNKNINIKLKKILELDNRFLILSRNNNDMNSIIDKDITIEGDKVVYNNKEYKYMTIHKSKGLEEDNVILINLTNGKYGFPSKNTSLNSLIEEKDKIKYEEERRLFYVALTRTKNYVYLFVDKEKPSIFVKEIVKSNMKHIEVLDL